MVFDVSTDDEPRVNYFSWLVQNATFLDSLLASPGLSVSLSGAEREERHERVPAHLRQYFPQLAITAQFPPAYLTSPSHFVRKWRNTHRDPGSRGGGLCSAC